MPFEGYDNTAHLIADRFRVGFILADTLPDKFAVFKEVGQSSVNLCDRNMIKALSNGLS